MAFGKVYANCNIVDVENGCKVLENSDIFVADGKIADIKAHGAPVERARHYDERAVSALRGAVAEIL